MNGTVQDNLNEAAMELVGVRRAQEALVRQQGRNTVDWGPLKVGHIDTGIFKDAIFGAWDGNDHPVILLREGRNLMPGEENDLPLDPYPRHYKGHLDDIPGHGTRTCGLIAADAPGQFRGVAPGVPVVPYRATNRVFIADDKNSSRVGRAIRDAVAKGCEIISISLGYPQLGSKVFFVNIFREILGRRDRTLGEAVDEAYEKGVIIVAAGGQIVSTVVYPGRFSRTICAGGVDERGFVYKDAKYEQFQERVNVWAPAANVSVPDVPEAPGSTKKGEGTSYATAIVAGAAALWLTRHRSDIERLYGRGPKRVEAFRRLLSQTFTPMRGNDYRPVNGTGILDVLRLVEMEDAHGRRLDFPDPDSLTTDLPKAAGEYI